MWAVTEPRGNAARSPLMTVNELAEHLLVSHTTIYRLLRYGHLPFFKVGGAYRFDRYEIDRWVAHRKVKTAN